MFWLWPSGFEDRWMSRFDFGHWKETNIEILHSLKTPKKLTNQKTTAENQSRKKRKRKINPKKSAWSWMKCSRVAANTVSSCSPRPCSSGWSSRAGGFPDGVRTVILLECVVWVLIISYLFLRCLRVLGVLWCFCLGFIVFHWVLFGFIGFCWSCATTTWWV